jgi:hypothetical protein
MAVNYKVTEIGGTYCVEEKATGHIIKAFDHNADAKKMMKFLNLGGGFDGFTPEFMVRKVNPTLNNSSKNMLST